MPWRDTGIPQHLALSFSLLTGCHEVANLSQHMFPTGPAALWQAQRNNAGVRGWKPLRSWVRTRLFSFQGDFHRHFVPVRKSHVLTPQQFQHSQDHTKYSGLDEQPHDYSPSGDEKYQRQSDIKQCVNFIFFEKFNNWNYKQNLNIKGI